MGCERQRPRGPAKPSDDDCGTGPQGLPCVVPEDQPRLPPSSARGQRLLDPLDLAQVQQVVAGVESNEVGDALFAAFRVDANPGPVLFGHPGDQPQVRAAQVLEVGVEQKAEAQSKDSEAKATRRLIAARDDIATPVNPAPPVKVMLINEWNGSAAETGAFMFQLGKVGKIVGKRTYGGGIGPYFFTPRLVDGPGARAGRPVTPPVSKSTRWRGTP